MSENHSDSKSSSAKSPSSRRGGALVAALAALLVLTAVAVLPRLSHLEPPGEGAAAIGGPFTLVDQTGHVVSDGDYRGKLMLIYFGYTFCPDVCPTALAEVAQAYDLLSPEQQKQVVPLFITVDPERDTVDQLAQYVGAFHPALVGLTGSPEQVRAVLQRYKVYARKVEGEGPNYTVDHSSIFYLMGRDGKFVSHFSHTATPQDIAAGLRKALAP